MTDKEKIRNQVEVLYCMTKRCETVGNAAFNTACKEILDFIDSLPEEPISEDLEKEIEWYMTNVFSGDTYMDDIARHFANWQRDQMMSKVIAEQECECMQITHRLVGGSWNLLCPTDKMGLKSGDKVKIYIIKED